MLQGSVSLRSSEVDAGHQGARHPLLGCWSPRWVTVPSSEVLKRSIGCRQTALSSDAGQQGTKHPWLQGPFVDRQF